MTTCSPVRLLIRWGYIKGRYPLWKKTFKTPTTGTMWRTCTYISFLLCYEARPFGNSWSGKRCAYYLICTGSYRIAGKRFELMGESQRDFTPELAAQRLRGCSDIHYLDLVD